MWVCPCRDPLAQFEVEKREHEIKMKKMENEMEEVFEMKVQEKLQKLKDIEADVRLEGVVTIRGVVIWVCVCSCHGVRIR